MNKAIIFWKTLSKKRSNLGTLQTLIILNLVSNYRLRAKYKNWLNLDKSFSEVSHFQNCGGQGNRLIVDWSIVGFTVQFVSVSQSHECVDSRSLSFQVPVSNHQECSNDVDVNVHAEISLRCGGVRAVNCLSLIQIVPIFFSDVSINPSAFLDLICFNIEFWFWLSCVLSFRSISDNCNSAVFVNGNHVLSFSELEGNNKWINFDWVIDSLASGLISVTESDESIYLGGLAGFLPGRDD